MATQVVQLKRRGWGETMRRDPWWIQPLVVFTVLSAFVGYATWAAFKMPTLRLGIISLRFTRHSSLATLRRAEHYDPLSALVRLFRRKP